MRLQVLNPERLLRHGRRSVVVDLWLLVADGEHGFTAYKRFAGPEVHLFHGFADDEDRVVGGWHPAYMKPATGPGQLRVTPGDLLVPGHGPFAGSSAPPPLLILRPLGKLDPPWFSTVQLGRRSGELRERGNRCSPLALSTFRRQRLSSPPALNGRMRPTGGPQDQLRQGQLINGLQLVDGFHGG
jgi:hypothetical protein